MEVRGRVWEDLWESSLGIARVAKGGGFSLERTIDTFDQRYRKNLSEDEEINNILREFVGLLKTEIREQWDSW